MIDPEVDPTSTLRPLFTKQRDTIGCYPVLIVFNIFWCLKSYTVTSPFSWPAITIDEYSFVTIALMDDPLSLSLTECSI